MSPSSEGSVLMAALLATALWAAACCNTGATDAGCFIDEIAQRLTTDAGATCGEFSAPYGFASDGWDAGPFEQAVQCAFANQDAGRAFLFLVDRTGIDSDNAFAYLRTPDGRSYALMQSEHPDPNQLGGSQSCVTDVDEVACSPEFESGTLEDYQSLDGGIPGLGCPNPGPTMRICAGDCAL
jgi:hypothetical protein